MKCENCECLSVSTQGVMCVKYDWDHDVAEIVRCDCHCHTAAAKVVGASVSYFNMTGIQDKRSVTDAVHRLLAAMRKPEGKDVSDG